MYVEEFSAPGPLTAETAEGLAAVAGRYGSRLTITSNDRSVQSPVLPTCWDVLSIEAGSRVTVVADSGHRSADAADRRTLSEFVTAFRQLTAER
ncbi:hypothetical protein [Nocardia jejuensis]|uniref:hypothetical protein n=1 Tax=Nocardia jejuensis TaxID=328049 RepID=UPI000831FF6E|nr:hypothetical protein [Nocardia jejuensis]